MSAMNSMKLRDLIRCIRQCKTASEERSLINKECANIREGFKEGTPYARTRNMLKLLYISMLGYPTEFGQLEVVNLLAQSDFEGKRIGYLALQLLLDEHDEVLTLAENHMKSDMGSSNPLVQAIALNAAANVASEDMARDVFDDVMRLIDTPNSYVKRKACLAAVRIVKKAPEHAEFFLESMKHFLQEKNFGLLGCSFALVNECLRTSYGLQFMTTYRQLAASAVRVLKSLVLSSRVTEHDVGGITDPFSQVKILEFMGIIGSGSSVTSEILNDILAQVITNTDASTNVGRAVHYECVRTIHSIESDEGLRVLAVNTISRFLSSSRDNNLRFVALQTLLDCAGSNVDIVQQYQNTILDCLRDPDVSIRRRALNLTVALITESNARALVLDLLSYMTMCSSEMRDDVTLQICKIIEEKSLSEECKVNLSLKLFKVAEQHVPMAFATHLIALISKQPPELQSRVVCALWSEASAPFDARQHSRKAFLVVAVWAIGELAEYLIEALGISCTALVERIGDIITHSTSSLIKQAGLTAAMKVASRYPASASKALDLFSGSATSIDSEVQQRACEYTTLLQSFPEDAAFSFARMPPICPVPDDDVQPVQVVTLSQTLQSQQTAQVLDDLFNFDEPQLPKQTHPEPLPSAGSLPLGAMHFSAPSLTLSAGTDELFGTTPSVVPLTQQTSLEHLGAPFSSGNPPATSSALGVTAIPGAAGAMLPSGGLLPGTAPDLVFECAEWSVFFTALIDGGGTQIHAQVSMVSRAADSLENISFQVAVPKTSSVVMGPLPYTTVKPNQTLCVSLFVDNTNNAKNPRRFSARIKLQYHVVGQPREHLFHVTRDL